MSGRPEFTGWPSAALEWFTDLDEHNNRAWFLANRTTYDDAVRAPMEALLDGLHEEFGDAKVSRPNRDTRFSRDKSPYKLRIYARVPRSDGGGGWFVQLSTEGLFVGGGVYAPDPSALRRIREAVADDRSGGRLETIVKGLEDDGLTLIERGALKTAPRGYPKDHPRIRLLRLPHLAAGVLHPPRKWLHSAGARDRVVEGWRRVTPLLDWAAEGAR